MFERFTDRAARLVCWGKIGLRLIHEGEGVGHNYIGTAQHILLGLIREGAGVVTGAGGPTPEKSQGHRRTSTGSASRSSSCCRLPGWPGESSRAWRAAGVGGRGPRVVKVLDQFGATSPSGRERASSTPSSAGRRRSSGSCRSCPAAPRTTRCSSASPASARRRRGRAWPRIIVKGDVPETLKTSRSTPSTRGVGGRLQATAVTSRSA